MLALTEYLVFNFIFKKTLFKKQLCFQCYVQNQDITERTSNCYCRTANQSIITTLYLTSPHFLSTECR